MTNTQLLRRIRGLDPVLLAMLQDPVFRGQEQDMQLMEGRDWRNNALRGNVVVGLQRETLTQQQQLFYNHTLSMPDVGELPNTSPEMRRWYQIQKGFNQAEKKYNNDRLVLERVNRDFETYETAIRRNVQAVRMTSNQGLETWSYCLPSALDAAHVLHPRLSASALARREVIIGRRWREARQAVTGRDDTWLETVTMEEKDEVKDDDDKKPAAVEMDEVKDDDDKKPAAVEMDEVKDDDDSDIEVLDELFVPGKPEVEFIQVVPGAPEAAASDVPEDDNRKRASKDVANERIASQLEEEEKEIMEDEDEDEALREIHDDSTIVWNEGDPIPASWNRGPPQTEEDIGAAIDHAIAIDNNPIASFNILLNAVDTADPPEEDDMMTQTGEEAENDNKENIVNNNH
jgi:hypothetical protein